MDIFSQMGIEIKGSRLSTDQVTRLMSEAKGDGPFLGLGGIQLPAQIIPQVVATVIGTRDEAVAERALVLTCGHVFLTECSGLAAAQLVRHGFPMRCRKCAVRS